MKKKIKEYKIYIIIISFISILWKAVKYGQDKEKLKQFKQNEKIIKKRKKIKPIVNTKQLIDKLRKYCKF